MVQLVLASTSRTRIEMLERAGLSFDAVRPEVDEALLRDQKLAAVLNTTPGEIASLLADAKALEVSRRRPGDLVIGADQVLSFQGRILSKAPSADAARTTLMELRGTTHTLISAVTLACDGAVAWRHDDRAELGVRAFSDAFLDDYIQRCGAALTTSVGAYQIEGLGAQLFDTVKGDYFTILGLPLLPLLAELRRRGVMVG